MRGFSLSTRSLIVAISVLACGDPSEPSGSLSIEIVDGDGQQAVTMNGAQTFTGSGYLADTLRVRVVNIKLAHLKPGQWRNLTDAELRGLLPGRSEW